MIQQIDITKDDVARLVLELQLISYEVEAKLINFYEIPPLLDTVSTLQTCGETFYGYFKDGALLGAISYEREGTGATICRMMVQPACFKKGIASALLTYVLEELRTSKVDVMTGAENIPAKQLYKRHGFVEVRNMQAAERLWLTQLERPALRADV